MKKKHFKVIKSVDREMDFSDWNFDDGLSELTEWAGKKLKERLRVIFGPRGAEFRVDVEFNEEKGKAYICGCVWLDNWSPFAVANVPLEELLINEGGTTDEPKLFAAYLRRIADRIDPALEDGGGS